jgi:hypothetical protein
MSEVVAAVPDGLVPTRRHGRTMKTPQPAERLGDSACAVEILPRPPSHSRMKDARMHRCRKAPIGGLGTML